MAVPRRWHITKEQLRAYDGALPRGNRRGEWDEGRGDGFSGRGMYPGELLVDPAANPALDAQASALLAPTADELADRERDRARTGMAAIRAERRAIVADLLAEGRTPADILAIAQMPGTPTPAWLVDELRRQAPTP
jgi:hypothetical protein